MNSHLISEISFRCFGRAIGYRPSRRLCHCTNQRPPNTPSFQSHIRSVLEHRNMLGTSLCLNSTSLHPRLFSLPLLHPHLQPFQTRTRVRLRNSMAHSHPTHLVKSRRNRREQRNSYRLLPVGVYGRDHDSLHCNGCNPKKSWIRTSA